MKMSEVRSVARAIALLVNVDNRCDLAITLSSN